MPIELDVTLGSPAHAAAIRAMSKFKLLMVMGGAGLVTSAMTLLFAERPMSTDVFARLVTTTFLSVVFLALPFLVQRLAVKNVMRNLRPEERRLHMSFDPTGFRVEGVKGRSEILWSGVHRVRDVPAAFLIYVSEQIAHFVPKDGLSPEQVTQLRAWMAAGVKERKPKRLITPARVFLLWAALIVAFFVMFTIISAQR